MPGGHIYDAMLVVRTYVYVERQQALITNRDLGVVAHHQEVRTVYLAAIANK